MCRFKKGEERSEKKKVNRFTTAKRDCKVNKARAVLRTMRLYTIIATN